MICKKCGAKIQKGSFFCDECGQSIGTVAELAELARQERRKKSQRRTLILAVLVAAGVFGYVSYKSVSDNSLVDLPSRLAVSTTAMPSTETRNNEIIIADETPDVQPEQTQESEIISPEQEATPVETITPTAKPQVVKTPAPTAIPQATTPPAPAKTPVPASTESNSVSSVQISTDYVYPSDTTVFTNEFLNSLTRAEARLARNELYARHGLKFKTADLQQYFASKSWYKPDANITTTKIHGMLNKVEQTNYQKLIAFEKRKGWIK